MLEFGNVLKFVTSMFLKSLKRLIFYCLLIGFGAGTVHFVYHYYSFIFSKKVKGVVQSVERINVNVSLLQQTTSDSKVNPQLFSFAVAIKDNSGEIFTSSAEDRQWAVVQNGQCVEALFYPYPPWNVMKAGTFYNARLDRLYDCQGIENKTNEKKGQTH